MQYLIAGLYGTVGGQILILTDDQRAFAVRAGIRTCERRCVEMVRVNGNGSPSIEAQIMYRRGVEMEGRGRFDAALDLLKKAIIIAPRFTKAFDEMGNCLDSLGRYPEALAAYNRILEIDPSHPGALFKRDRLRKKIGSLQSAVKRGREEAEERPVRKERDPGHSLMNDLAVLAHLQRQESQIPSWQADPMSNHVSW
jgi:tetratricopeptide (TPR) repeat protein